MRAPNQPCSNLASDKVRPDTKFSLGEPDTEPKWVFRLGLVIILEYPALICKAILGQIQTFWLGAQDNAPKDVVR